MVWLRIILGMARRAGWMLGASAILFSPLSSLLSQAPRTGSHYNLSALAPSSFLETISTSVTSRSGSSEERRTLARTARYGVKLAGDTVVVSGDSLDLTESGSTGVHAFDASGFIGGRWKLFISADGAVTLLARPFVPDDIAQVNDVSAAMDDFFPPPPPMLVVNASASDTSHYQWTRLSDSSGSQRYRWTVERQHEETRAVADTVPLKVRETTRESGTMVWSSAGAPLGWARTVHSEVNSSIRGRSVQAVVDQRIVVRRME